MREVSSTKASLRIEIQKCTRALSREDFKRAGRAVAKHIERWLSLDATLLQKRRVALFKSLKDELATAFLTELFLSLELEVCYPTFSPQGAMRFASEQEKGREWNASECDLIFVPGLAFDRAGHRLGRGLGCYDQALRAVDASTNNTRFIGLALDIQVVEQVPVEPHDVRMHFICSPALGLLRTSE